MENPEDEFESFTIEFAYTCKSKNEKDAVLLAINEILCSSNSARVTKNFNEKEVITDHIDLKVKNLALNQNMVGLEKNTIEVSYNSERFQANCKPVVLLRNGICITGKYFATPNAIILDSNFHDGNEYMTEGNMCYLKLGDIISYEDGFLIKKFKVE